jgi:hypothetical protein
VEKQVDAAELRWLRVAAAAALSVAADAVLVARHLPKFGAHKAPIWLPHWPVCMCNISLEKQPGGGEHAGEERRHLKNSVWQFGTGNGKLRWRARVYPERENKVVVPLRPLELLAPFKARWV